VKYSVLVVDEDSTVWVNASIAAPAGEPDPHMLAQLLLEVVGELIGEGDDRE
jgi:hypothetical protein